MASHRLKPVYRASNSEWSRASPSTSQLGEPLWQFGVNHTLENGELVVSIGAEDNGGDYPELTKPHQKK